MELVALVTLMLLAQYLFFWFYGWRRTWRG